MPYPIPCSHTGGDSALTLYQATNLWRNPAIPFNQNQSRYNIQDSFDTGGRMLVGYAQ